MWISHVFDVRIKIIRLPLELLKKSFARLVSILRATYFEKTSCLIHFWLSLVSCLCNHSLFFVVWVQASSANALKVASAVLIALFSSPALASISNLSWRSVPLLTISLRWSLELADLLVKNLIDFRVEFLHILLFRDLSFAEIWGIHALFTYHVDLIHNLLVVHRSLKLTHFL